MQRDADARAHAELAPGDPDGLGERVQQTSGDGDRVRLVAPVDEHRELVASQPCERVAGPDFHGEALRDRLEQLVTRVVAQAVVDLLEAVQVDEQEG